MTRLLRRMVVALAALSSLFAPLNSVAESVLDFSLRSENRLAMTMLSDAFSDSEVTFSASQENGVTDIQIDLDGQSIYLRRREGELHIHSSKNTARTYSTLSEDEKVVLGTMANLMEESLEQENRFYAATICVMMHFADWPSGMPLMVSLDPVELVVGDTHISRQEMIEARRQAIAEAIAREQSEGRPESPTAWVSLCNDIGFRRRACYPTSLVPYRERCETVLVGGRTCRGRCGTACSGLCTLERYTQDCFNHDRCADVYGITNLKCDAIFGFCADDCFSAPACNDIPGAWRSYIDWWNDGNWGTHLQYYYPDGSFRTSDGYRGVWSRALNTVTFTILNGDCQPITYTAQITDTARLMLDGTMSCPTNGAYGSWYADKTNSVLPAQAAFQNAESRNNGPADGSGSPPARSTTGVESGHPEMQK